ncbi:MAG: hypothetical protein JWN53_1992, partial [Gemmatimonadetes bacterium]|nr:hypothetical protein [Gemmatimonadota bacterium]
AIAEVDVGVGGEALVYGYSPRVLRARTGYGPRVLCIERRTAEQKTEAECEASGHDENGSR